MTKFISRTFVKGLVIVFPVFAAGYVLVLITRDTEAVVRTVLIRFIPEAYYVPGSGVAVALGGIFALGLLMYPWLTRKILQGADYVFRMLPVFGTVYGPVRDLMDMFGGDMAQQLGRPVVVKVPNTEMETLGFITRRSNAGLPKGFIPDNHVVVYVQWSSQIGGYCFIVPQDAIREVDLTVEEGLRWALTAGISGPADDV